MKNLLFVLFFISFIHLISDENKKSKTPKAPYQYKSLNNLSDDEIIKYMGYGKTEPKNQMISDKKKSNILKTFWKLSPKDAAIELVKANTTSFKEPKSYLKSPELMGKEPPTNCKINYSIDGHILSSRIIYLCTGSKKSFIHSAIVYQRSYSPLIYPEYDLKCIELTEKESKHLRHIVWWLYQLGDENFFKASKNIQYIASHEQFGYLSISFGNEFKTSEIKSKISYWSSYRDDSVVYDHQIFLNILHTLFNYAIPRYLDKRWADNNLRYGRDSTIVSRRIPQYTKDDINTLHKTAKDILQLYLSDKLNVSRHIVAKAVNVIGMFSLGESESLINSVLKKMNFSEDITKELIYVDKKMDELRKISDKRYKEKAKYDKEFSKKYLYIMKTQEKLNKIYGRLYQEVILALKRLTLSKDLSSILKLACSFDNENAWALKALKRKNHEKYLNALKWRFKNIHDHTLMSIYTELNELIPDSMDKIIAELPKDMQKKVNRDSLRVLKKVNKIQDVNIRVDELIKYSFDDKDWRLRRQAIRLLIPSENPFKYKSKKIDHKLLSLLDKEDKLVYVWLSRRGRVEYFEKIKSELLNSKIYFHSKILGFLSHLSQQFPIKLKAKLLKELNSEFNYTKIKLSILFNLIWTADLKSKRKYLEVHSTISPDEAQQYNGSRYAGSQYKSISGKYHQARKILSLWNEKDDLTRGKLLIAFALQNLNLFHYFDSPDREFRYKAELKRTYALLNKQEKEKLLSFLDYIGSVELKSSIKLMQREEFVALTKKYLSLKNSEDR